MPATFITTASRGPLNSKNCDTLLIAFAATEPRPIDRVSRTSRARLNREIHEEKSDEHDVAIGCVARDHLGVRDGKEGGPPQRWGHLASREGDCERSRPKSESRRFLSKNRLLQVGAGASVIVGRQT
jgi:hypothetical protein